MIFRRITGPLKQLTVEYGVRILKFIIFSKNELVNKVDFVNHVRNLLFQKIEDLLLLMFKEALQTHLGSILVANEDELWGGK